MCHSRTWNIKTNKFYKIDLRFVYYNRQSGFEGLLKDALSGLRRFLATENPLKVMKIVFYFAIKALYVLKIFRFLSWIFGQVEKLFDQKDQVDLKIYDVTTRETNNYNTHRGIEYTQNISRSKGNQTKKSGQLIEHNMRNIFLEKLYTKCGAETIPRHISKKSKLGISLDNWSKVLSSSFLFYAKLRMLKCIETKLEHLFFLI